MSCNCKLNDTLFIYDLLNSTEDISFTKNLTDIIPSFNPSMSGIWRPVFWSKKPQDESERTWTKVKGLSSSTDGTTQEECTDSTTPEGLGISNFVRIYNPKLRHWYAENFVLDIDWIINFQECKEYSETVLFWYRYYDMGRDPENRFIPGVDIYISDGDFAVIDEEPEVTDNLLPDSSLIKGKLIELGLDEPTADYQSKVMATGPQLDWISINLLNVNDTNTQYPRDEYGFILPFLSGVSLKRYNDIGKNNFIATKLDLVKKLTEKNGIRLTVPESTEASLISKFTAKTGPNLAISFAGELYRYDKKQNSGYDIHFKVGDLELKAARTGQQYTPPAYVMSGWQYINGQWQYVENERTEAKPHDVNNITFNDRIIGFNLSNAQTGVFNPDFSLIKFHGLGGVSFQGGVRLGQSCTAGVSLDPSGEVVYNNSITPEGPYFLQDYVPANTGNLEQPSQPIIINIKTHSNAMYRLKDKISIDYLRTDSKPACEPFVTSSKCDCFPLKSLYPDASGKQELNNADHLLFTPNVSLYHVPTGAFYAGLSGNAVTQYGVTLPNHPAPLTPFPKIHKNFFPMDTSCSYSMNGCGNKVLQYEFPYPGKFKLDYQSPSGNFKVLWNNQTWENEPPKYTNTAGSICFDKTAADPSIVTVQIGVPTNTPNTSWGISISGTQNNYTQLPLLAGLPIQGMKGFFHPNFGWTFDPKYHNKTPLIPYHKGVFYRKRFNNNLAGYKLYVRYSNSEGPCPGGHTCDSAKFDIYVNDVFVGVANLNNGGGAEDPGPSAGGDRTAYFSLPSSVQVREGNRVDILIKCAYTSGCHGGIAWVQIINNKGQTVYNNCINTEQLVTLYLNEMQNNYFYNAYAMYDEEYLPGYNYIFNTSGLSEIQKSIFKSAAYIGIKVPGGNSFYINRTLSQTQYVPSESLILDQVPFEYVNMDLTYGYAYNDFVYDKIGNNKIKVISSTNNDDQRAAHYVDHPSYKQTELKLYKYSNTNQTQVVSVTAASGNEFTLNNNLPEGFEKGLLSKNKDNQSVLIYRPYSTENDPYISIGKWGNLSYGEAFIEASKYFQSDAITKLRRYNNSSLRTGFSKNTSLSWSTPIKFVNDYNFDSGEQHYFPVSRLFTEWAYNGRVMHTVGYDNQYTAQSPTPDGDLVVASGSIDKKIGYLYCGNYIGPLEISVTLSNNNATKGNIKLYHNNVQVANKSIATKTNNNIIINFNKESALPIYAKIELEDLSNNCFGLNTTYSDLTIKQYKVKINQSNSTLRQKTRIAYYAHKPTNPTASKDISFAVGFPNQILKIDNKQASPVYTKKFFTDDRNKDFSPYLDMHIFSQSKSDMPLSASSGYVFFEDFFQPKSPVYIASGMEVPYNQDLYWFNFDPTNSWDILTSKGILIEANKQYKILKKLEYDCQGSAEECAKRYNKNICDEPYELSIEDVFDLLGISNNDQQFFDIKTVSMPTDCDKIDRCCDSTDYWTQYWCLYSQQQDRDNCKNFWKNQKTNTSCVDAVCPSGNITGTIQPTAEYFVIKLKENIQPQVLNDTEAEFYFFTSSDEVNIPCTDLSFPSIGASFLHNYNCSAVENNCEYILLPDYTISSNYIPGELLDLSPIVLNTSSQTASPVPSSVIMANEETYRSIIPHDRVISMPFNEYDPMAESKYVITHTFNIKSKECVEAGGLFNMSIDDWNCNFSLTNRPSGLVLTSCFDDIMIKSSGDVITQTINGTVAEGEFSCISQPYTYIAIKSCSEAKKYIEDQSPDYEFISCKETSLPENYSYQCQFCGPSCSTEIVLSYDEPMQKECFCPGWLQAGQDNNGNDICSGQYDTWSCNVVGDCNQGHKGSAVNNPQNYQTGAYCFAEIKGPTKEQIDNYNNACPEVSQDFWKETVTKNYRYEFLSIPEEPNTKQSADLSKKNVETFAQLSATMNDIGCQNNKCNQNCNDQFPPNVVCCNQAGNFYDANAEARSACQCKCTQDYYKSEGDARAGITISVNCHDNCGESDQINADGMWSCGWGWYWWYSWGFDCSNTSSSWNSTPWNQAQCGPATGCDYKACSDIEKRYTPYTWVSSWDCEKGGTSTKKSIKIDVGDTIKTKYTHKKRKITTITKTKQLDTNALYDPDSGYYEKVKIYNKSFEIQYRNKKSKACSDQDKEKGCCDKADIDITITATIYQNLMHLKLSANGNNQEKCVERDVNNHFKCPVITYKRTNDKLYICDNVTSQCVNCNVGKLT